MISILVASLPMIASGTYCAIERVQVPELRFGVSAETAPIDPGFQWDEAIVSWNVEKSHNARLKVEAKISDRWYVIAEWSGNLAMSSRRSVPDQKTEEAEVLTDILKVKDGARQLILRLTLDKIRPEGDSPAIKRLAVCFSNSAAFSIGDAAGSGAKRAIPVPQEAQGPYELGKLKYQPSDASPEFEKWFKAVKGAQYCSPTCVSMILRFWAKELNRPELNIQVPTVVPNVFDEKYPGTGNWSFNTAYMGSFPGMISYVTRLTSISDLEAVVDAGIPVVCSVSHNLVLGNGKPAGGDGHLVIVVGFDDNGDVIANDPGISAKVRRTYKRSDFMKGWNTSKRTVYICHPESIKLPSLAERSLLVRQSVLRFFGPTSLLKTARTCET